MITNPSTTAQMTYERKDSLTSRLRVAWPAVFRYASHLHTERLILRSRWLSSLQFVFFFHLLFFCFSFHSSVMRVWRWCSMTVVAREIWRFGVHRIERNMRFAGGAKKGHFDKINHFSPARVHKSLKCRVCFQYDVRAQSFRRISLAIWLPPVSCGVSAYAARTHPNTRVMLDRFIAQVINLDTTNTGKLDQLLILIKKN